LNIRRASRRSFLGAVIATPMLPLSRKHGNS
jgi:hypothetical protein